MKVKKKQLHQNHTLFNQVLVWFWENEINGDYLKIPIVS